MGYARRIAYNTVVQVIGRLATTITSFLTVGLLNAGLGADRWGQYVAATTYLGLFAVLADMGVNTLFLREIARYPEKTEEVTSRFLGFRLVTAFLVLGISPALAYFLPTYSRLLLPIAIIAAGQFFIVLNQMLVSIFQARLIMDRAMLTDLLGRIAILSLTFWVVRTAPAETRLIDASWAVAIGSAVNLFFSYLFVRNQISLRPEFAVRQWPALAVQVLPMGAMAVLALVHFRADSVIMALVRPETEVGIYGNAYKIVDVVLTLPGIFVGSLIPQINQAILKKDPHFHSFIQKAFDLLLFAAVPMVAVLVLFAPYIIGLLTRENIFPAAHSLQILSLAMVPWFIGTLMGNILLGLEEQGRLSRIEALAVALNIGLNIWVIPRWSYLGAATTTVVTEVLTTACTAWLVYRRCGFRPSLSLLNLLIPVVAGLAAVVYWVGTWENGRAWQAYASLGRFWEAGWLAVSIALFCLVFLVPFLALKRFPPVLQEKVSAWLNR